jgi:hypothetical protein
MPRLHLIVEGQTEQAFAAQILVPHLANRGVFLSRPQLAAHAREKRIVHRGGILSYKPFKNDILRRFKEDHHSDVFFSTMIDLYKVPQDFPGYEAAYNLNDPYERIATIENAFQDDVKDSRFIPYVQLHEFEALLFSCPRKFAEYPV